MKTPKPEKDMLKADWKLLATRQDNDLQDYKREVRKLKREIDALSDSEAQLAKANNTLRKQNDMLNDVMEKPINTKTAGIHELLDAAIQNLLARQFVQRGIDSKRILSQVRSARETLRRATRS